MKQKKQMKSYVTRETPHCLQSSGYPAVVREGSKPDADGGEECDFPIVRFGSALNRYRMAE